MKVSRVVPEPEIKWDAAALLKTPALWDSVIFNQVVPPHHEHLWHFIADPEVQYLCVEVPAGSGKTQFISIKASIYFLCLDPNDRICILQKGIGQAKGVISAIQRHMVANQTLIDLYGPFKPESGLEGYPWSTDTMRIAGNTNLAEKTNSVHAYGWSSTDVMGNRFQKFLGDDFVTTDNSDTPEKRAKIRTKEETEWDPTLVGAANPRFFYQGTPMFYDDAFESKKDMASDYLGPEDWRLPHEVDKSGWVFIRRSAEKGKRKGTILWPEQLSQEFLDKKKKKGYVNYLRRYCCEVGDPSLSTFKEIAIRGGYEQDTKNFYPGCLDYDRKIGEFPPGLPVICGADPSSGKKTGESAQFAHVTLAYDRKLDVNYIVDLFTAPIPVDRRMSDEGAADKLSQVGTIIHRHHKYGAKFSVVESNSQQHAWVDLVKAADASVRVVSHNTGRNKVDPEVGVDGMAGLLETGKIRFPYGDKESQELTEEMIVQLVRYPNYSFSDLIMAMWFCIFRNRKRGMVQYFDISQWRSTAKPLERATG